MRGLRILLVAPPLAAPFMPSLAVEQLAAVARAEGHRVRTLHGPLWQPAVLPDDIIDEMAAPGVFAPGYYGIDPVAYVGELVDAVARDASGRPVAGPRQHRRYTARYLHAVREAEACVRTLVRAVPEPAPDVVGFSVAFDTQKVPAAAIARALRARGVPGLFVVGGTGMAGEMGPAFLAQFAEFDVAVQGDADPAWPMLLERVRARRPVHDVPGCVSRRGDLLVTTPGVPGGGARPAVVPDYTSYLADKRDSPYRDSAFLAPVWTAGQPAARIGELHHRFRPDVVYCTDDEVPAGRLESVGAGPRPPVFCATSGGLSRQALAGLARAGVAWVQPDIDTLAAPALPSVSYLKWARAYGMAVSYDIRTGTPGETAGQLREMAALVPLLAHLPPPQGRTQLRLERFSDYFDRPEEFGIHGVRPFATQRVLYRCEDSRLLRLCHRLDYRVRAGAQDEEYLRARDRLDAALAGWVADHHAGATLSLHRVGHAVIVGQSLGGLEPGFDIVNEPDDVLLLSTCAEPTTLQYLAHMHAARLEELRAAARRLRDQRLMLVDGDTALALPVPGGAAHAVACCRARSTAGAGLPSRPCRGR
ncbi:MAG TPA: hypothetical protein VJT31_31060 [Rugosimonospora sp.]|nr:hypothetical protein [Rugosimonospora sp.]